MDRRVEEPQDLELLETFRRRASKENSRHEARTQA